MLATACLFFNIKWLLIMELPMVNVVPDARDS